MPPSLPEPRLTLNREEARGLALAAQGFLARRGSQPSRWPVMRRTLDTVGLLQIDSVSALIRSHYLPLFSRLGTYPRAVLDKHTLSGPRRGFFEYWGHEASFLPFETHALLRWRMQAARRGEGIYAGLARFARERSEALSEVARRLAGDGPMTARALAPEARKSGPWWGWTEAKRALEFLFWAGEVTAIRQGAFERVYGLPEQLLPDAVLAQPTPAPEDAKAALILKAAQALGVATPADLRDYYRMGAAETHAAIARLVEAGALEPVDVEGWRSPGLIPTGQHRAAGAPRPTCLLSPFDSLVFDRDRTERVFGFHYRLEFYVPPPKRVYGYYVMPFLHRGRLIGRVDLRAKRGNGALVVPALHWEGGHGGAGDRRALAGEVIALADWLDLPVIQAPSSLLGELQSQAPGRARALG